MRQKLYQHWRLCLVLTSGLLMVIGTVVIILRVTGTSSTPAVADHYDEDPVVTDVGVAAASLAAAVHSYNPAEDDSPADAIKRVQDRVTGKYRVIVESRNKAPKPKQWDLWAEHNDRVHAVAEPTADFHAPPADATTATVPLTIRVFVWHEDGDTTPLYTTQAQASMVKEPDSDAWKLSDLEYVGTISQ